jgi:hypothetical protein
MSPDTSRSTCIATCALVRTGLYEDYKSEKKTGLQFKLIIGGEPFFGKWHTQFSSKVKNQCKVYHSYFITIRLPIWHRYLHLPPTSGLEQFPLEAEGLLFVTAVCSWSPSSLLTNGYRKLFPINESAGAWNWSITSIYYLSLQFIEKYPTFPYIFMGGAQAHGQLYLITSPTLFIPRGLNSINESESP